MNLRKFNKLCRLMWGKRGKKELDIIIDDATKHSMLLFIVRKRGAVHVDLVTDLLDLPWLRSMGYLYGDKSFIHTSETLPRRKNHS